MKLDDIRLKYFGVDEVRLDCIPVPKEAPKGPYNTEMRIPTPIISLGCPACYGGFKLYLGIRVWDATPRYKTSNRFKIGRSSCLRKSLVS